MHFYFLTCPDQTESLEFVDWQEDEWGDEEELHVAGQVPRHTHALVYVEREY